MSTNQNVNKLSAALAAWSKRREERVAPGLLGLALLIATGADAATLDDVSYTSLPGDRVQVRMKLSAPLEGAPLSFTVQGGQQIVALLREKMGPTEYVVQTPHAIIVKVQGSTATARSTIHEVCRFADGAGLEMTGTYFDDLVKVAQGWRFKRRTYRCTYLNPQPPAGQVFRNFKEPA